LWNALARINQVKWIDPKNEAIARDHLEEHAEKYKRKVLEDRERQFPININQALIEELMKLPYIREAKAEAIIEHRTQRGRGPFQCIEELMEIGPKIFQEIRACIIVGN
jgi:competence ComEA-like helix-hairpin-helix protein